jgi:Tfp pilus assembly PilM family ATPase
MALLFKKKESVACMLDDRSIRFFHIANERDQFVVKKYLSERIPDELFDAKNNLITNTLLTQRLSTIRTNHGFKKIHIVIPDRYVTVFHTIVPLPTVATKDLQKYIEQYLTQLLTEHPEFSAADMVSDYNVISTDDMGIHLHVAVARPERFKHIINALMAAGFEIDHIDIASFSMHRIAKHMNHASLYGTLSIGTHSTSVSIVKSGKIITSTVSDVGSEHLIHSIQTTLNISRAEAEKIIRHYGILHAHPDKEVLANLFQVMQPLAQTIVQLLEKCSPQTYRHPFYHTPPQEWYVYGVGASIAGVAQYLGIKTHTHVHPIDIVPTEFIDESVLLQVPAEVLPMYLPVLSTAMNYLLE